MFEDAERIRDTIKISDLPEKERKAWESLLLHQLILHLALHLRDGVHAFLAEKRVARDADPSLMAHPETSQITGLTLTPEELRSLIPSVPVGAYPEWMHIGSPESEMGRKAAKKALELAEIIVGKTDTVA